MRGDGGGGGWVKSLPSKDPAQSRPGRGSSNRLGRLKGQKGRCAWACGPGRVVRSEGLGVRAGRRVH